ncbi:MAG TPA: STAS domain-containing protein [Planctomycetota bacterium]|nr:STAS domain-containing protein [Planctomycetota bacterium]
MPVDRTIKVAIEAQQGLVVIHVAGSVDHVQYYQLEEAIQTQLDRRQLNLVVNLSDLTYISSAGINTLGHAVSQFEKVKGKLCYVRPANTAQWHFFTTIGVDQIFPWASSVEEAIKKVGPAAP